MAPGRASAFLATLVFALIPLGCTPDGPPPPISYYAAPLEDFARVQQVAFVGLSSAPDDEAVARDTSFAIFQAIQGKRMFQANLVERTDPALESVDATGRIPMTYRQMSEVRQALKCDAILLGSLSEFQQYPRMRMTIRLRLMDLRRGKLLWGVDQVWDTTDKATEERVRHYFCRKESGESAPMDWRMGIVSPRSFEKFVAFEIARTLPCREDADDAKTAKGSRAAAERK